MTFFSPFDNYFFLLKFVVVIRSIREKPKATEKESEPEPEPVIESDPESDVELDNEGVVEPDNDPEQPMGDHTKTPSEEEREQASEFRSEAAAHYSEQRYEEAIASYEKAILANPTNALFHAKRGQAYLKLKKPNACIRDCNRALELNPDSAAAYKFRGRGKNQSLFILFFIIIFQYLFQIFLAIAHRLLGHWEEAAKDLRQACKLDFDEEADEWLREVTPNAKKLEAHKIKQERKKAEKDERERRERVRRAQEANKRAAEEQQRQQQQQHQQNPFEGAGAGDNESFDQADLLNAFKDPEVAAAFQDIVSQFLFFIISFVLLMAWSLSLF